MEEAIDWWCAVVQDSLDLKHACGVLLWLFPSDLHLRSSLLTDHTIITTPLITTSGIDHVCNLFGRQSGHLTMSMFQAANAQWCSVPIFSRSAFSSNEFWWKWCSWTARCLVLGQSLWAFASLSSPTLSWRRCRCHEHKHWVSRQSCCHSFLCMAKDSLFKTQPVGNLAAPNLLLLQICWLKHVTSSWSRARHDSSVTDTRRIFDG